MSNRSQEEKFITKHKPMTPEEINKKIKEKEEAKKKYEIDAISLEKELQHFNEIEDPLVNPETDKAMCWVRRPTQAELEEMVPKEFFQYQSDPSGIPPEVARKYGDLQFEMMSKLITRPKHDAKWWKEHANQVFIMLFQFHLQKVLEDLGIITGNF
jgi:hypothetical protein